MPDAEDRIVLELLGLPLEIRAALAVKLIESLDDCAPAVVGEQWAKEIERRLDDLDNGRVSTVPGEAAMNEARQLLP